MWRCGTVGVERVCQCWVVYRVEWGYWNIQYVCNMIEYATCALALIMHIRLPYLRVRHPPNPALSKPGKWQWWWWLYCAWWWWCQWYDADGRGGGGAHAFSAIPCSQWEALNPSTLSQFCIVLYLSRLVTLLICKSLSGDLRSGLN